MICIKTKHLKFNRILLLSIGLWPYERTRFVQFQTIFNFSILISNVIYQFAMLMFLKCTPTLVINVLSIALFCSTFAMSFYSSWINIDDIKWLIDELQHICNDLKDENEIAIITKYGNIARRLTAIIMLFHVSNCSTLMLLASLLHLLDVLFADKSESHHVMQKLLPKFFIGQESYMYVILLYFVATAVIGGTALIGIGMLLVTYQKHICGMFRIASYRIEKAMMLNMLGNEIIITKEIIHAVDIHRKAILYSMLVFSTFKGTLLFLLVMNVICLTFNLYRISEIITQEGDIEQCYLHFIITIANFIFLFLMNYVGQEITDYNNYVFFTAYNVRWYVAPLHIQRLILFLLQNGSKVLRLSIGGVLSLSIELFTKLTKTSLSYFTVVHSMQQ